MLEVVFSIRLWGGQSMAASHVWVHFASTLSQGTLGGV